jgi:rubrerythrin
MPDEQAVTCGVVTVIWRNTMEHLLDEAVRVTIVIIKKSYDFFRSAAVKARSGSVRRLCERLADEEARHLEQFLRHYPCSEFGEVESLPTTSPYLTRPQHRALLSGMAGSIGEKEALQVALQEKEICLDYFSAMAQAFREPEVHAVFQKARDEALRHCEVLREECRRLAGRDNQNVSGRKVKRPLWVSNQATAGQDAGSSCLLLPA